MTKVINLFAGPGAGKSTTAAGLFYKMKRLGLSVELVTEYAKEKVYENALDIMADQLYLLAKQNRKLDRLVGKVDWIITDSPLLLCAYYGEKFGRHPSVVVPTAHNVFDLYHNINFFIERTKPFDKRGRLGSEKSALQADAGIRDIVYINSGYTSIVEGNGAVDEILKHLGV